MSDFKYSDSPHIGVSGKSAQQQQLDKLKEQYKDVLIYYKNISDFIKKTNDHYRRGEIPKSEYLSLTNQLKDSEKYKKIVRLMRKYNDKKEEIKRRKGGVSGSSRSSSRVRSVGAQTQKDDFGRRLTNETVSILRDRSGGDEQKFRTNITSMVKSLGAQDNQIRTAIRHGSEMELLSKLIRDKKPQLSREVKVTMNPQLRDPELMSSNNPIYKAYNEILEMILNNKFTSVQYGYYAAVHLYGEELGIDHMRENPYVNALHSLTELNIWCLKLGKFVGSTGGKYLGPLLSFVTRGSFGSKTVSSLSQTGICFISLSYFIFINRGVIDDLILKLHELTGFDLLKYVHYFISLVDTVSESIQWAIVKMVQGKDAVLNLMNTSKDALMDAVLYAMGLPEAAKGIVSNALYNASVMIINGIDEGADYLGLKVHNGVQVFVKELNNVGLSIDKVTRSGIYSNNPGQKTLDTLAESRLESTNNRAVYNIENGLEPGTSIPRFHLQTNADLYVFSKMWEMQYLKYLQEQDPEDVKAMIKSVGGEAAFLNYFGDDIKRFVSIQSGEVVFLRDIIPMGGGEVVLQTNLVDSLDDQRTLNPSEFYKSVCSYMNMCFTESDFNNVDKTQTRLTDPDSVVVFEKDSEKITGKPNQHPIVSESMNEFNDFIYSIALSPPFIDVALEFGLITPKDWFKRRSRLDDPPTRLESGRQVPYFSSYVQSAMAPISNVLQSIPSLPPLP